MRLFSPKWRWFRNRRKRCSIGCCGPRGRRRQKRAWLALVSLHHHHHNSNSKVATVNVRLPKYIYCGIHFLVRSDIGGISQSNVLFQDIIIWQPCPPKVSDSRTPPLLLPSSFLQSICTSAVQCGRKLRKRIPTHIVQCHTRRIYIFPFFMCVRAESLAAESGPISMPIFLGVAQRNKTTTSTISCYRFRRWGFFAPILISSMKFGCTWRVTSFSCPPLDVKIISSFLSRTTCKQFSEWLRINFRCKDFFFFEMKMYFFRLNP